MAKLNKGSKKRIQPNREIVELNQKIHIWDNLTDNKIAEDTYDKLFELAENYPRAGFLNFAECIIRAVGGAFLVDDIYDDDDFFDSDYLSRIQDTLLQQKSLEEIPVFKKKRLVKTLEEFIKGVFTHEKFHLLLQWIVDIFQLFRILTQIKIPQIREVSVQLAIVACGGCLARIKHNIEALEKDNEQLIIELVSSLYTFWLEYLLKERMFDAKSSIRDSVAKSLINSISFVEIVALDAICKILKKEKNSLFMQKSPSLKSCDWVIELIDLLVRLLNDVDEKQLESAYDGLKEISSKALFQLENLKTNVGPQYFTKVVDKCKEIKSSLVGMSVQSEKACLKHYECIIEWTNNRILTDIFTSKEKTELFQYIHAKNPELRDRVASDLFKLTIDYVDGDDSWKDQYLDKIYEVVLESRSKYFNKDVVFDESELKVILPSILLSDDIFLDSEQMEKWLFDRYTEPEDNRRRMTITLLIISTLQICREVLNEDNNVGLRRLSLLKPRVEEFLNHFSGERFIQSLKGFLLLGKLEKGEYLRLATGLMREIGCKNDELTLLLFDIYDISQDPSVLENIIEAVVSPNDEIDPLILSRLVVKAEDCIIEVAQIEKKLSQGFMEGKDMADQTDQKIHLKNVLQRTASLYSSTVPFRDLTSTQLDSFFQILDHIKESRLFDHDILELIGGILANLHCNKLIVALEDTEYEDSMTQFGIRVIRVFKEFFEDGSFPNVDPNEKLEAQRRVLIFFMDIIGDLGQDFLHAISSPLYRPIPQEEITKIISIYDSYCFKAAEGENSMNISNILATTTIEEDGERATPTQDLKISLRLSSDSTFKDRVNELTKQMMRLNLIACSSIRSSFASVIFNRILDLKEESEGLEKLVFDTFIPELFALEGKEDNLKTSYLWMIAREFVEKESKKASIQLSQLIMKTFRPLKYRKDKIQLYKYYNFCQSLLEHCVKHPEDYKKCSGYFSKQVLGDNCVKKWMLFVQEEIDKFSIEDRSDNHYEQLSSIRDDLMRRAGLTKAATKPKSPEKAEEDFPPEIANDPEPERANKKRLTKQSRRKKAVSGTEESNKKKRVANE